MQRAMQRANLHGALHLSTTILMDNGAGGAFQAYVLNDISQVSYTASGLTSGNTYRFKVRFTSEAGESAESTILSVVAATVPSKGSVSKTASTDNSTWCK